MVASSLTGRLRRPEYTGENRCLPCTVLNVALVTAAAVVVATATMTVLGAVLFVAGMTAVYFRGYVVPGTPTLTSYLPDRVLAYFDHHEPTVPATDDDEEFEPDPAQALRRAGAVEECADVDDLCLVADFRTEWREAMADVRADESVESLVRDALGDEVAVVDEGGELYAHRDGEIVGRWPSRTAAIADFAADRALGARLSNWDAIDPGRRSVVARGLRPFLDQCPDCDGPVAAEKVTSCCISGKAQTVRHCSNCGITLFESEPYTDLPESGA